LRVVNRGVLGKVGEIIDEVTFGRGRLVILRVTSPSGFSSSPQRA